VVRVLLAVGSALVRRVGLGLWLAEATAEVVLPTVLPSLSAQSTTSTTVASTTSTAVASTTYTQLRPPPRLPSP